MIPFFKNDISRSENDTFDKFFSVLHDFVSVLNTRHPKIKFKVELEHEGSINFLDLTIRKEGGRHVFEIYRKPTHTDAVIPASSCHPWSHKLAAFHAYVNRLMTIPLSREAYEKEVRTIYAIARANGYSQRTVDRIIEKHHIRSVRAMLYAVLPERVVHHYRSSVLYVGVISERIARVLRDNGVHVAFRTNNTIRRVVCNGKEKTELGKKSGVYKLTCDECGGVYVGQTGRSFEIRYKEHMSAVRNERPERSHFAKHLLESGHSLSDGHSYKVLHNCQKGLRLGVLEQLEIIRHSRGSIFNDQINVSSSPLLRIFNGWRGGGAADSINTGRRSSAPHLVADVSGVHIAQTVARSV